MWQELERRHPILSVAGNGEERSAQIDRIQERLSRLRQMSAQLVSEVAAVTADMDHLTTSEPVGSTPKPKPTNEAN